MSDTPTKICSRPGCTKKLRPDNRSGMCWSGCLSPEAPPSLRAGSGTRAPARPAPREDASLADDDAMKRFRAVAEGLGFSPDALLNEFAETWLSEVKAKVTA